MAASIRPLLAAVSLLALDRLCAIRNLFPAGTRRPARFWTTGSIRQLDDEQHPDPEWRKALPDRPEQRVLRRKCRPPSPSISTRRSLDAQAHGDPAATGALDPAVPRSPVQGLSATPTLSGRTPITNALASAAPMQWSPICPALGVSRSRLEAVVSFGENQPVIFTQDRERQNRRTVTEVSGFVQSHPTVLNGKYAEVIFREYVESATEAPSLNQTGVARNRISPAPLVGFPASSF